MTYRCPKCGAVCKSLFFDRRNKIIFCDVCAREITEFKLEEEYGEGKRNSEGLDHRSGLEPGAKYDETL